MSHENLVEINNLTFRRGEQVIYDDISLTLKEGKITALMGPSGIGKTTLLRLIGGQLKPDAGEVRFKGHNVPNLSRRQLYRIRKDMSMLFQSGALFTDMSVFDNVAFPLRENTKLSEDIIATMVRMKLQAVGLFEAQHLMPSQLSGGMSRRAALARAIALEPDLVMYDEPFSGQDPIAMLALINLIKELNENLHMTSLVVTHDVSEIMCIADYIYILKDKKILAEGTPEQLSQIQDPWLEKFLSNNRCDVPVEHPNPDHYIKELLGA